MQRSYWIGCMGMLMLGAVSLAQETSWSTFAPSGEGFRVQLPGKPRAMSRSAAGIEFKMYALESPDKRSAYMVSATKLPIPANEDAATIQQRLDGARDGALRNSRATLTKETKIRLQGKFPGREVEASLPGGIGKMRVRFFIVNGKIYQTLVLGQSGFVDSKNAEKFLNSLALTN